MFVLKILDGLVCVVAILNFWIHDVSLLWMKLCRCKSFGGVGYMCIEFDVGRDDEN